MRNWLINCLKFEYYNGTEYHWSSHGKRERCISTKKAWLEYGLDQIKCTYMMLFNEGMVPGSVKVQL